MLKKFSLELTKLNSLIEVLPNNGIIILSGDLASGKTTLVKAIVKYHGMDLSVTSPTFSIMQNYGQIYHYDIYQNGIDGIKANGLFENFFEEGLHIVEWGDEYLIKMLKKYELDVCIVKISGSGDKRTYEVDYA